MFYVLVWENFVYVIAGNSIFLVCKAYTSMPLMPIHRNLGVKWVQKDCITLLLSPSSIFVFLLPTMADAPPLLASSTTRFTALPPPAVESIVAPLPHPPLMLPCPPMSKSKAWRQGGSSMVEMTDLPLPAAPHLWLTPSPSNRGGMARADLPLLPLFLFFTAIVKQFLHDSMIYKCVAWLRKIGAPMELESFWFLNRVGSNLLVSPLLFTNFFSIWLPFFCSRPGNECCSGVPGPSRPSQCDKIPDPKKNNKDELWGPGIFN